MSLKVDHFDNVTFSSKLKNLMHVHMNEIGISTILESSVVQIESPLVWIWT